MQSRWDKSELACGIYDIGQYNEHNWKRKGTKIVFMFIQTPDIRLKITIYYASYIDDTSLYSHSLTIVLIVLMIYRTEDGY